MQIPSCRILYLQQVILIINIQLLSPAITMSFYFSVSTISTLSLTHLSSKANTLGHVKVAVFHATTAESSLEGRKED